MRAIKKFMRAEDGATMMEYALIVAVVSLVLVIPALSVIANTLSESFIAVQAAFSDAIN